MVNSASGYEFVKGDDIDGSHPHGDLDRIVIDGGIMPLRTGTAKNALRGEDIAFLLEFVKQRAGVSHGEWGGPAGTIKHMRGGTEWPYQYSCSSGTFHREIVPESIIARPPLLFGVSGLVGNAVIDWDETQSDSTSVILDAIASQYGGTSTDLSFSIGTSGGGLSRSDVESVFSRFSALQGMGVLFDEVFFEPASYSSSVLKDRVAEDDTFKLSRWLDTWGYKEYYDDTWNSVFTEQDHTFDVEAYVYPSSGHDLISVTVPHASRAVCLAAFGVKSGASVYIQKNVDKVKTRKCVIRAYEMTADGGSFVLKSDLFASAESVDGFLSEAGVEYFSKEYLGVTSSGTYVNKIATIKVLAAYVVVVPDDHTKWVG